MRLTKCPKCGSTNQNAYATQHLRIQYRDGEKPKTVMPGAIEIYQIICIDCKTDFTDHHYNEQFQRDLEMINS